MFPLLKIGEFYVNPANILSFRRTSGRPCYADMTDPRVDGIEVTFITGVRREWFAPGLWESFSGWMAAHSEVTELAATAFS